MNGFHGRMLLQSLGECHCVLIVLADSQCKSSQAPKHQPGVERSESGSEDHVRVPDIGYPFLAAHYGSGDDVGMSAEILRCAVEDQVDAKIDWALIQRRGE